MPAISEKDTLSLEFDKFNEKFDEKIKALETMLNSAQPSLAKIQEKDLLAIAELKKDMQEAITVYTQVWH